MALVLKDRVKQQTTTTGQGTITLSGSYTGFQSFEVIGDDNVTYYTIYDQSTGDWEVGYGTYTSLGTTLSRDVVYDSSNAGNKVDLQSGTKVVFCTYPAEQAIYQETNGNLKLVGGVIGLTQDGTEGTTLPNTSFQAFTTGNYYMQANQQNLSSGAEASSDYICTANNGSDTENYIDVGMASSGYNYAEYSAQKPNSGYVMSTGADLRLIAGKYGALTPGGQDIVIIAGSTKDTEERARVYGDTGNVNIGGGVNATDTGERLQVEGSAIVTGAVEFGDTVLLAQDPTLDLEAATKQYVDTLVSSGFHVHQPVEVATTANLTATYSNGSSGVGATLTNSGTQAAIEIDGVSLSVNERVLVWSQSTQTQNGVYVVTTVGSGSTNWVLTRASDADTYAPQSDTGLGGGDYFFVNSGSTYGFSSFVCTNDGTITFGSTAITFQLFSTVPSYVVEAPLNLTGNTLSLSGTVSATHGGTGINTTTTGDLLYSATTNSWSKLNVGSTGQSLIVSGGLPAWGSLDLAGAGVSGVLPETHGGTNQASYTKGDTLYSSNTNTLAKLSGNTSTTRKFMSQTGTGSASAAPTWDTVAASDITSGTLAVARGGTGLGSYAIGDIVYASGTGTLAGLADAATGNVLLSGGINTAPSYGKVGLTTHISGTLPVANGGTGLTSIAAYSIPVANSANTYTVVTPSAGQSVRLNAGGTAWEAFTPSTGTVTSVTGTSPVNSSGGATPAISLASGYGDTQNPYASKTAKYFLAAPNAASGDPTFRAIVASDIPTLNQNTTGTAGNVSGVVAIANGGTGLNAVGANGTVLTSNGSSAAWAAPTAAAATISYFTTTITTNTTFASGQNGLSVGPVTVSSGVSVTVPSGQKWVVL